MRFFLIFQKKFKFCKNYQQTNILKLIITDNLSVNRISSETKKSIMDSNPEWEKEVLELKKIPKCNENAPEYLRVSFWESIDF